MNDAADQLIGSSAHHHESDRSVDPLRRRDPYEYSLIGEYSRMLLLLVALPLLLWLIQLTMHQHTSLTSIMAAALLLISLVCMRGVRSLRVFLLAAMTINIFAAVVNPNDFLIGRNAHNPLAVPNVILLICLTAASLFETGSLIRESSRPTMIKFLCWGVLAIPAFAYVLGVPLFSSLWEVIYPDDSAIAARDPEWTLVKEMSLRTAKFLVFAIFTYLGACIGSFLNVVAYCIPRGESIGMRDSSCPRCQTKISRLDNLPIFSYINLSARCRSCRAPIPARYLVAEILVAVIFGSLFLYELVTGATNVPAMEIRHSGILWIVLYPKWKVIGIYFFHCFFMSFLVVFSLIEWDRQKLGLRSSLALVLTFLIAAALYPALQPIPSTDFLSSFLGSNSVVSQIVKPIVGGAFGTIVGGCFEAIRRGKNQSTFIPAMAIAGIVLGWQSVLHVSVLFILIQLLCRCVPKLRIASPVIPTALLLFAVLVHHPFWKLIFQYLSV